MYLYVPHYNKNYEAKPTVNADKRDISHSDHKPTSMATPHEHSVHIEKKLKSMGYHVHRVSDVHINVDKDTNIESHSVGSYLQGNDKNKLYQIHKSIVKPTPEKKPKNFLKTFTDINNNEAGLIYEDVQQIYYISKQLNESIRYFKVKAPSYQIAEEVVSNLLNN